MSNLEGQILDGMDIYDVDRAKIGQVVRYDPKLGYFETGRPVPLDAAAIRMLRKNIFLPVTSVAFLDDQGVHLSEMKDTITSRFARVPEVARAFFAS